MHSIIAELQDYNFKVVRLECSIEGETKCVKDAIVITRSILSERKANGKLIYLI